MKTLITALFMGMTALSAPTLTLTNSLQFFYKETLSQPVPTPLCTSGKLQVPITIPQNPGVITRVYSQEFTCQDIKAKISVYYHVQPGKTYFSQQVTLSLGQKLLSMCSGYFPATQNFLIPGACAGVSEPKLFGFSLAQ